MTWETVIGLEVHAQLNTATKLFSGSKTQFGAPANTQTSFIDAGLPGTLPVLNHQAICLAIQFGIAIQAEIQHLSYFERKNYFYPDLPKGYQISQCQRPIVNGGHLDIQCLGQSKRILIEHAHLEEDAGKSIHDHHGNYSGIDLNRAGIPLLEIVTTPCLSNATEVVTYLRELQQLLRFLRICDGNMQEGSFRCDVNLSLRKTGDEKLGTRTELKNLNSFRFIEKAIAFETARHQALLESGRTVAQQTLLYCPDTNTTQPMRDKENENDYRYFADPDLLPIQISNDDIDRLKQTMPLLPTVIRRTMAEQDHLSSDDIGFLLTTPDHVEYYKQVKQNTQASPKLIVNWLKGTYAAALKQHQLTFKNPPVSATQLGYLLDKLVENSISGKVAKDLFNQLLITDKDLETLFKTGEYQCIHNNQQLEVTIQQIMQRNPAQVAEYRAGKEKLIGFFMGQVMKATNGQADPEQVDKLLRQQLAAYHLDQR